MYFSSSTPMVIGNWKMNLRPHSAEALTAAIVAGLPKVTDSQGADSVTVVLCPPVIFLPRLYETFRDAPIIFGAQACHEAESGAYTGDIAASMIHDCGGRLVLIGHSERRAAYGENAAQCAAQIAAAHKVGLHALLCVGEDAAIRDAGQTFTHIARQLDDVFSHLETTMPDITTLHRTVAIAYEPIWAIGSGKIPTTRQISDVHCHIRKTIGARLGDENAHHMPILYGGSVTPATIEDVIGAAGVTGVLVGGASLNAESFLAVIKAVSSVHVR